MLGLIGVGLAALGLNTTAKESSKKASPGLNTKQFDADCARHGIVGQDIMDVAARCGVRPNKFGVLPENGWKRCIKYASNYVNAPGDIDAFKRDWLLAVEQQLAAKSNRMVRDHWDSYQHQYHGYLKNKEFWTCGPEIVLEFKHWHGLPKDQYLKRLEDLQVKTFWGELVVEKPILRYNPRFEDSFIETWVVQGGKYDRQDRRLTHNQLRSLYVDCCGVCGYDAML